MSTRSRPDLFLTSHLVKFQKKKAHLRLVTESTRKDSGERKQTTDSTMILGTGLFHLTTRFRNVMEGLLSKDTTLHILGFATRIILWCVAVLLKIELLLTLWDERRCFLISGETLFSKTPMLASLKARSETSLMREE